MPEPLYLDHAAATPVRPEVARAVAALLLDQGLGNPASAHTAGLRARAFLEDARSRVAAALGGEVLFTSGGTESVNLAILGAARAGRRRGRHVVAQATEHACALRAVELLARDGFEVTWVPVDARGVVDPDAFASAARPDTVLAVLMHANNETGVLQPIREVASALRGRGRDVHLHVDAVQSAAWLDVSLAALGGPFSIAIAGHKLGGPAGVGALALGPGVALEPILAGGRQERGLRPGTVPVALAVGLARALELVRSEHAGRAGEVAASRDALQGELLAIEGAWANGAGAGRLPGHLSVGFEGVSGEAVAAELDLAGISASSGSACATGEHRPSHVLLALGQPLARARAAVRFSLGRPLSRAEGARVAAATRAAVERLRAVAGRPDASSKSRKGRPPRAS